MDAQRAVVLATGRRPPYLARPVGTGAGIALPAEEGRRSVSSVPPTGRASTQGRRDGWAVRPSRQLYAPRRLAPSHSRPAMPDPPRIPSDSGPKRLATRARVRARTSTPDSRQRWRSLPLSQPSRHQAPQVSALPRAREPRPLIVCGVLEPQTPGVFTGKSMRCCPYIP